MTRLIIAANRLPIRVSKTKNKLDIRHSPGGVASALSSLSQIYDQKCVGWPGITDGQLTGDEKVKITEKLTKKNYYPIFLSEKQLDSYYCGFSNETLWPLFHYFPARAVYENSFWQAYKEVNHIFCDKISNILKPNDIVWVHDYHLMLLPKMLREKYPHIAIGYFLHIPFPSFELFRLLPWRDDILDGLLGADLIGFHTYDYVRHFLSSVCRLRAIEHNAARLRIGHRIVKTDAFPMGIDYKKYSEASQNYEVQRETQKIRKKIGNRKIVLSVDRLDYTKGIIKRLEAFDLFLSQNPGYRGHVALIMVVVPSRTGVEDYAILRSELEQLIGRVNGVYGSIGQMPVWYLYQSLPFEQLTALYHCADSALVTPLRDGMNLISKEFVAVNTDGRGVLILSEMTGSASELGEAIIVNANNKAEIVAAIKKSLEMTVNEQLHRNRMMQKRLKRYTVSRWANDFVGTLDNVKQEQQKLSVRKLAEPARKELVWQYGKSKKRLLLLDYDGTMADIKSRTEKMTPDTELIEILKKLADDKKNELIVMSGTDKDTLTHWFGWLNTALIAEHGAWIRQKNAEWLPIEPLRNDWKQTIRPILEMYEDRTPGSSIEEKDFALIWHFDRSNPELAGLRTQEMRDAIMNLTENLSVGVFEGDRTLEIKNIGIGKSMAVEQWLKKENWDFVLAAGDDYTDEDLFAALPETAYSVKIGYDISEAKFNLHSVSELRTLLKEL